MAGQELDFGPNQKTIKQPISFKGIGLHTGEIANIKINPAEPNTGIIFKRTDIKNNNHVIPGVFNVKSTLLCIEFSSIFLVAS